MHYHLERHSTGRIKNGSKWDDTIAAIHSDGTMRNDGTSVAFTLGACLPSRVAIV